MARSTTDSSVLLATLMGLFSRRRAHGPANTPDGIEISEQGGIRALHLGSRTIQSAMRVARPFDLELEYTRRMMAFLLFHPDPRRFLLIGLGGGSLTKFVWDRFPEATSVTVELNPQVIAAARCHFFLPPDDERLSVVTGDGAEYVARHPDCCDVLLVDGFDGRYLAESLTNPVFYDHCRAALGPDGVLATNLWSSDPRFPEYLEMLGASFDQRVLCLPSATHGNVVAMAFKKDAGSPRWDDLRQRAAALQARFGLDFAAFAADLKHLNPHTDKRLLI